MRVKEQKLIKKLIIKLNNLRDLNKKYHNSFQSKKNAFGFLKKFLNKSSFVMPMIYKVLKSTINKIVKNGPQYYNMNN